jgi:PAS domain S-box-containing protein
VQSTLDPSRSGHHESVFRIVRRDGEVRWVRDTGRVHFEGEGAGRRAVRVVGTVQDITDRKQVRTRCAKASGGSSRPCPSKRWASPSSA